MKYKIAHVGAFDFENFGDLLFTDVLEVELKKRIDIESITYFAPKACKMPGKCKEVYSVTSLEEMCLNEEYDAIVVGGGDLVHFMKTKTYMPHISNQWVDYEVIYIWMIPCIVAQKCNVPLIWNAVGVPMYFSEENKEIVSILCDSITYLAVRDMYAKDVLAYVVNPDRINVIPDTVLGIRDLFSELELESVFETLTFDIEKKKYVFFQGNTSFSDNDVQICADTLLQIKHETGYTIVLQPIGYALGDIETLNKINNLYPDEFILSSIHLNQYQILALVANAALYIGSSLHGCITANSYGVKNIVYNLNNFRKTDGFVSLIEREDTRVYNSRDLLGAYKNLREIQKEELNVYIKQIENHFDKVANIIEGRPENHKKSVSARITECIYKNNVNVEQLKKENKEISDINSKLEEEVNSLLSYKRAYNEIKDSSIWKVTKPIRLLLDLVKKHN